MYAIRSYYEYGYRGDIMVMPNGCDMPIAHRDEIVRSKIAAEYNLDSGNPIFLFVGRLTYTKNIHLIVKALGALNRITSYNVCYTKLLRVHRALVALLAGDIGMFAV